MLKSKLSKLVYKTIAESKTPVTTKQLRERFGKEAACRAHDLARDRRGEKTLIKGRKVLGIGMEYIPVEREWPPKQPSLIAKAFAERERRRAARGTDIDGDALEALKQLAYESKTHPFFNEKFVPYMRFFPEKTRRKYEFTARVMAARAELERINKVQASFREAS